MVGKFVDNTKSGNVEDIEEYLGLQQDLDQMGKWAKWAKEMFLCYVTICLGLIQAKDRGYLVDTRFTEDRRMD